MGEGPWVYAFGPLHHAEVDESILYPTQFSEVNKKLVEGDALDGHESLWESDELGGHRRSNNLLKGSRNHPPIGHTDHHKHHSLLSQTQLSSRCVE